MLFNLNYVNHVHIRLFSLKGKKYLLTIINIGRVTIKKNLILLQRKALKRYFLEHMCRFKPYEPFLSIKITGNHAENAATRLYLIVHTHTGSSTWSTCLGRLFFALCNLCFL